MNFLKVLMSLEPNSNNSMVITTQNMQEYHELEESHDDMYSYRRIQHACPHQRTVSGWGIYPPVETKATIKTETLQLTSLTNMWELYQLNHR